MTNNAHKLWARVALVAVTLICAAALAISGSDAWLCFVIIAWVIGTLLYFE